MSTRKTLVAVIALMGASQLAVSSLLGLGDAEALYFAYSRHLALSYLDHPPLVGWLIRGSTALFGQTVLGLRLVAWVSAILTLVFTALQTREMFGERAARCVPLLMLATPVFSIGLTAATPDAPLAALFTAFTWQAFRAVNRMATPSRSDRLRPLGLGLILGLAFLAKYTGALLAVTALLVLFHPPNRYLLKHPLVWVGAAVAMAATGPVLAWNLAHDFAGVLHRLSWTQTGAGFSLRNAGALVGGQLLYVGPLMLVLFFDAVRNGIRDIRNDKDPSQAKTVLIAASLPTLAAGYLLVLWSDVAEPHWPAAGYLPLFPLVANRVADSVGAMRRMKRWAIGFGLAVFAGMHLLVMTPLLPALTPASSYEPKYDLANELRGWPEVADAVRALNPEGRPVVAGFYTQCAQLAFALNRDSDPPVRCISKAKDDFDYWYPPFVLDEDGALFVDDNRFRHRPEALLPDAEIRSTVTLEISRGGQVVRRFRLQALGRRLRTDAP